MIFFSTWAAAAVVMFLTWLYSEKKKNASYVDAAWAFFLLLFGALFSFFLEGNPVRTLFACLLFTAWSGRLFYMIFFRRILFSAEKEDGRYRNMRSWLGEKASFGFFVFFQMQAVFVLLFLLPLFSVYANTRPFQGIDILGLVIGFAAILGEALADVQLTRFRENPANRGKTCQDGLWRYSRHPNYFFEWLHWFAYLLMGIGSPYQVFSFLGPVVVFIFLMKITGIPYTEKQAASHRPDYAQYKKTTNLFFPGPKKEAK